MMFPVQWGVCTLHHYMLVTYTLYPYTLALYTLAPYTLTPECD